MAKRTWEELEQPILESVADLEDHKRTIYVRDVAERAGLPADQVAIGVRRLLQTDLLDGRELIGGGGLYEAAGLRLLPRGRQAVGQWPSADPAEAFLQALAHRIAVERTPRSAAGSSAGSTPGVRWARAWRPASSPRSYSRSPGWGLGEPSSRRLGTGRRRCALSGLICLRGAHPLRRRALGRDPDRRGDRRDQRLAAAANAVSEPQRSFAEG